jgi:hypothetical protein
MQQRGQVQTGIAASVCGFWWEMGLVRIAKASMAKRRHVQISAKTWTGGGRSQPFPSGRPHGSGHELLLIEMDPFNPSRDWQLRRSHGS